MTERNEEEKMDYDEEVTDVDIVQPMNLDRIDKDTVIANMQAQQEIFKEFLNYVKSNLVAKVDFYTVVEGGKPSLGQPGSEKILDFLRTYPRFVVTYRVLSRSEVTYDVTCNLYSKVDNRQVGSGGGLCTSMEDNYLYEWVYENKVPKGVNLDTLEKKNRKGKDGSWYSQYRLELANHYNIANTVKKMALKRAMVDATIRSTFASHIFTQDLEDSYIGFRMRDNKPVDNTSNKAPTIDSKAVKPVETTKPQPTPFEGSEVEKPSSVYVKQDLDFMTFKIVNSKSKYYNKTLGECPTWFLKGQAEWIVDGKFDPTKYGYDKKAYLDMYYDAMDFRAANKVDEGE
jgi:hypothetical protein